MLEDNNIRTVLVTGGRGFIGTHLVRHLSARGLNVVSIDILPARSYSEDDSVIDVQGDVRDSPLLRKLFETYRFSCVYDLASYAEVGLKAEAYTCNTDSTTSITTVLSDFPQTKYLFYSTQFVFRKPNELPSNPLEYYPVDTYGSSKVESERIIRSTLEAGKYLILRPSYIWGPGLERFRDGLLRNLQRGRMLIPLDSKVVRSYGYVETISRQTFILSEQDFGALDHDVFYLTDRPIALSSFCEYALAQLKGGGYYKVPGIFIKKLGLAGQLLQECGFRAPINMMQARELTTNFPIPFERTLKLTQAETDYEYAMKKTIQWAKSTEKGE